MEKNERTRRPGKPALGLAALALPLLIETALAGMPVRELLSHRFHDGQLHMKVTDGLVVMSFQSENAIEVVFTPTDAEPQQPSLRWQAIPVILNTGRYDPGELRVAFYADPLVPASSSQVYDDDGTTPGTYEKGQYELLQFRSERTANGGLILRLSGERHDYPGRPDRRNIQFQVYGLERQPSGVRLDGNDVSEATQWDEDLRRLELPVTWEGHPRSIEVAFSHEHQATATTSGP